MTQTIDKSKSECAAEDKQSPGIKSDRRAGCQTVRGPSAQGAYAPVRTVRMLGSDSERHRVATVHVASWSAASASAVLMATRVRLALARCSDSRGRLYCTACSTNARL